MITKEKIEEAFKELINNNYNSFKIYEYNEKFVVVTDKIRLSITNLVMLGSLLNTEKINLLNQDLYGFGFEIFKD